MKERIVRFLDAITFKSQLNRRNCKKIRILEMNSNEEVLFWRLEFHISKLQSCHIYTIYNKSKQAEIIANEN